MKDFSLQRTVWCTWCAFASPQAILVAALCLAEENCSCIERWDYNLWTFGLKFIHLFIEIGRVVDNDDARRMLPFCTDISPRNWSLLPRLNISYMILTIISNLVGLFSSVSLRPARRLWTSRPGWSLQSSKKIGWRIIFVYATTLLLYTLIHFSLMLLAFRNIVVQ